MNLNVPSALSAPPPPQLAYQSQGQEPLAAQPQPIRKQVPQPEPPKALDLLTLKKQVMEEIRQELENEAKEKYERDERAHQALIAQRQRDIQKQEIASSGQVFPESQMDTQIMGHKPVQVQEADHQSDILNALRTAQADSV